MFVIMTMTDGIVAVSEEICYVKTQQNGTTIVTDVDDATAVYCKGNDTFYPLREDAPGRAIYRVVEVEEVPEDIPVDALLFEDGRVTVDIEALRKGKLAELGAACEAAIFMGTDAETTQGTEHFSLTINDQTNIGNLTTYAQEGTPVLYHADGKLCRVFSPEEMLSVAEAAIAHKTYHTTLCNHMNMWARRADSVEELSAITYDSTLPDDLAQSMALLLDDGKPQAV